MALLLMEFLSEQWALRAYTWHWCRNSEDCIRCLNIPGYTLYSAGRMKRPRVCILTKEYECLGAARILF